MNNLLKQLLKNKKTVFRTLLAIIILIAGKYLFLDQNKKNTLTPDLPVLTATDNIVEIDNPSQNTNISETSTSDLRVYETSFISESPDKKIRLESFSDTQSNDTTNLVMIDTDNDQKIITYEYPRGTVFTVCWSDDSSYAAVGYSNDNESRTVIYLAGKDMTNIGKEIFAHEFSYFEGDESIISTHAIHDENPDAHISPLMFTDNTTLLISIDWLDRSENRITRTVSWNFNHASYTIAP